MEKLLERKDALPHALLLKGRSGTGKLDFAMHFSRSLLCESPLESGQACGTCPACTWFSNSLHPDFRMIEPEGEGSSAHRIAIDQIRAFSDFIGKTTHRNGYKIVLIHPAEAMNQNAGNALLKTLEEPQGKSIFILVTSKPSRLLPTILSRCQSIAMPSPSLLESEAWLEAEGIHESEKFLAESGNAPLVALDIAHGDPAMKDRFLSDISSNEPDALSIAEFFQKSDLSMLVSWMQKWCHDLASFAFCGKIRYFPGMLDTIRNQSARMNRVELARFQRKLCEAQKASTHPVNQRLFIEELILSYRGTAANR
jgi:DNA polymerase-3 subunit delta'